MNQRELAELYPRTRQQLVHASMFVIGLLLAGLVGLAAAHHASDRQVIGSDDLKHSVQELESYSAEASVLLNNGWHGRATEAYTNSYLDTLQQSADSLGQDLQKHAIDPSIQSKAGDVQQLSAELSRTLTEVTTSPGTPDFQNAIASVKTINQQLKDVEEQL